MDLTPLRRTGRQSCSASRASIPSAAPPSLQRADSSLSQPAAPRPPSVRGRSLDVRGQRPSAAKSTADQSDRGSLHLRGAPPLMTCRSRTQPEYFPAGRGPS
jgi:hypothetical protein